MAMAIITIFLLVFLSFLLILGLWLCRTSRLKPHHMPSLHAKHIFITGASSGIGLAIAQSCLRHGAFVTLVARSSSRLDAAARKLVEETHCDRDMIHVQIADVGDFDAISAAVAAAVRWRPIDVLVCNAGITRGGYLDKADIEDLDAVLRTNINGTVYTLNQALPALKERSIANNPVSIVIMSSLASFFFLYGHAVYTASKYALRGLAEGLRAELLPYRNIKVSVVCPGFVDTPLLDDLGEELEGGGAEIGKVMEEVNLVRQEGWTQKAEDVSECVVEEALRKGKFMVCTQNNAISTHLLVSLGRGITNPPHTFPAFLFDLFTFLPFRLFSFHLAATSRRSILTHTPPLPPTKFCR